MDRRDYIRRVGAAGLIGLAGCSGEEGSQTVRQETDTPTAGGSSGAATPTETETEAPTETATRTDTPTETATETETATATPAGEADIVIGSHELVVNEGEFTTNVYVAAEVTNEGDAPSGTIELTADWYDADGNYLDNSSEYLQSLGPGETWAARVEYLGSDAESVDDYEFDGTFDGAPAGMDPDGLTLLGSEMDVGEDEVVISGEVENGRDEAVSYIQATVKIYDGDGVVLTDEWTNVSDVPAGETWAFEVTWMAMDQTEAAADHEVWLSDAAF